MKCHIAFWSIQKGSFVQEIAYLENAKRALFRPKKSLCSFFQNKKALSWQKRHFHPEKSNWKWQKWKFSCLKKPFPSRKVHFKSYLSWQNRHFYNVLPPLFFLLFSPSFYWSYRSTKFAACLKSGAPMLHHFLKPWTWYLWRIVTDQLLPWPHCNWWNTGLVLKVQNSRYNMNCRNSL